MDNPHAPRNKQASPGGAQPPPPDTKHPIATSTESPRKVDLSYTVVPNNQAVGSVIVQPSWPTPVAALNFTFHSERAPSSDQVSSSSPQDRTAPGRSPAPEFDTVGFLNQSIQHMGEGTSAAKDRLGPDAYTMLNQSIASVAARAKNVRNIPQHDIQGSLETLERMDPNQHQRVLNAVVNRLCNETRFLQGVSPDLITAFKTGQPPTSIAGCPIWYVHESDSFVACAIDSVMNKHGWAGLYNGRIPRITVNRSWPEASATLHALLATGDLPFMAQVLTHEAAHARQMTSARRLIGKCLGAVGWTALASGGIVAGVGSLGIGSIFCAGAIACLYQARRIGTSPAGTTVAKEAHAYVNEGRNMMFSPSGNPAELLDFVAKSLHSHPDVPSRHKTIGRPIAAKLLDAYLVGIPEEEILNAVRTSTPEGVGAQLVKSIANKLPSCGDPQSFFQMLRQTWNTGLVADRGLMKQIVVEEIGRTRDKATG